jgi:hypothetical protein
MRGGYHTLRDNRYFRDEENNGSEGVPLKKRGAVLLGYTFELMMPAQFPTEINKAIVAARVYTSVRSCVDKRGKI